KAIDDIIAAIQAYVDGLSSGQPVEGEKLLKAIATVKEVAKDTTGKPKAKVIEVTTWHSGVGQEGTEKLTDAVFTALQSIPATDSTAQKDAIARVLTDTTPSLIPDGGRIADRSLIQSGTVTGAPAKDEDIEKGQFQVIAKVGTENWWIVLDLEPADIILV
ncbi:MAG TPA: hypothetical protein V6C85_17785, partial [Allocoleopsis sp.]